MNRRGFMGLLGKLVSVGAAMGILPAVPKLSEKAPIPEVPVVTFILCSPGCPMCEGEESKPTFTLAS